MKINYRGDGNHANINFSLICISYFYQPVIRTPASLRFLIQYFLLSMSLRSLTAVSGEHLVIFAHLDEVSFPANPSNNFIEHYFLAVVE